MAVDLADLEETEDLTEEEDDKKEDNATFGFADEHEAETIGLFGENSRDQSPSNAAEAKTAFRQAVASPADNKPNPGNSAPP
jgi:hypothetical protein